MAALAVTLASTACGDETEAPAATRVQLSISRPETGHVTRRAAITVVGRVTEGATVVVDATEATVVGGRFESRVDLVIGRNPFDVTASCPGPDRSPGPSA